MDHASYRAPVWLPGAHAQTIYPLCINAPAPALLRERLETPDGDFVDIDHLPPRPGRPTVLLFHGLEGSSRSHYARSLLRELDRIGWNGSVLHFRGCSGEPNRLARAYHSGDSSEIDWVIRHFAARSGAQPVFAAGVSLGANALCKWLGEQGEAATSLVRACASVCAPLDLAAAGHALGRGLNRVFYTPYFLRTLIPRAQHKAAQYPGLLDAQAVGACRDLYQFDNLVTAPLHGFRDTDDYWARAAAKPLLTQVRVPLLLLQALNDPFVPAATLPRADEVSDRIVREYTHGGGHVGFVTGAFPGRLDWLARRLIAFFGESG